MYTPLTSVVTTLKCTTEARDSIIRSTNKAAEVESSLTENLSWSLFPCGTNRTSKLWVSLSLYLLFKYNVRAKEAGD